MQEQPKNNKKWIRIILLALLVVVIVVIVVLLFRTNETYTSDGGTSEKIDSLTCTASELEDPFFKPENDGELEHMIKATFKGGKLDKLSYSLEGKFSSDETAEYVEADLHADYNIYMGKNNLSQSMLNPSFSAVENRVKVSLLTDAKNLTNNTIVFFFLNMDEFQTVRRYSMRDLAKLYENKGFSCIFSK